MPSSEQSLTEMICRTYKTALFFLGAVALFLPSFSSGSFLISWYILLAVLALGTLGMCMKIRFQRFHRVLRPFIVGRILQFLALVFFAGVVLEGVMQASRQDAWIPYGTFWILSAAMTWRYFRIFQLAAEAKHKTPDRCEFC
jgi:hypothetical protein